jgi:hypothetical protein
MAALSGALQHTLEHRTGLSVIRAGGEWENMKSIMKLGW